MKKKLFLIIVILVLVVAGCSNGKVAKATDQKTIERVAKIAAMLEIDDAKALEMLENEKMTAEQYKEIITAITLDATATGKFVQMKTTYVEQYKK